MSITSWNSRTSSLDIWYAAEGGEKLMLLLWSEDDLDVRTFKRPHEWAPELIALSERKAQAPLH